MTNRSQHVRLLQDPLRVLMVAAALLLLTYVALLAAWSPTGFPTSMVSSSHWPSLIDKPVGEDGFYMLTVADNIATKGHILYNRGVPATGIQPLATMLFAALDRTVLLCGGGAVALIRSVMALGAILFVVFALQISRITAALCPAAAFRREAAALGFLLTLFSFTLFRLFTYGLETGIYLMLIAACFQVTLHIAERQHTGVRDMVLLGLLAGCAGEARIDFGLLFSIVLGTLLVYRWISWSRALGAGALALLVVSPWFWFVHSVSGSWLPSSGKAESTLIGESTLLRRIGTMAVAVAGEIMPWCYAIFSRLTVVAALLSAVTVLWLLAARPKDRQLLRGLLLSRHGRLWLACLFSLVPIYLVLFNATHFYYRYLAPLAVVTLPVCAVVLAHADWVRRHMPAVTALLCAVFAGWAAGSMHTGHLGNSQTIAAGYVRQNFPETHVGSFQSGVMGFFNRNVENLDGKLNAAALDATQRHQLPQFVDSEHIDVLVDWPSVLHANLPPAYLQNEWKPCPIPVLGDGESICLMRKQSDDQITVRRSHTTPAL